MEGAAPEALDPSARYRDWRKWWLVARFRERYPHDIPTPGHLQAMATMVDGLGSPWNISTNWKRCNWYHNAWGAVSIFYRSDLCTFDFDHLTRLVLAAHKHRVRVEIEAGNMQGVRIIFWPRDERGESMSDRHPTLEELAAKASEMAAKRKAGT